MGLKDDDSWEYQQDDGLNINLSNEQETNKVIPPYGTLI